MIATEDEKSSRKYFQSVKEHVRSNRIVVLAEFTGSAPNNVVEAAVAGYKERLIESKAGREDKYDEIWIVFDTEGPQNLPRRLAARDAIARVNDLALSHRDVKFLAAVSNPSFEYWLLLHFEYNVSTFVDGESVCSRLRKNKYIKGYEKTQNAFELTIEKVGDAIRHSKRVFVERYPLGETHPCDCHPSTGVHLLMESLGFKQSDQ